MIEGGRGSVNTEWLTSCYLEIQRDFALCYRYLHATGTGSLDSKAILLPLLLNCNCLLFRIIFEQSSVVYKMRNCEKEKHVFVILKGCIIQQWFDINCHTKKKYLWSYVKGNNSQCSIRTAGNWYDTVLYDGDEFACLCRLMCAFHSQTVVISDVKIIWFRYLSMKYL